jgi:hypothetical protein
MPSPRRNFNLTSGPFKTCNNTGISLGSNLNIVSSPTNALQIGGKNPVLNADDQLKLNSP